MIPESEASMVIIAQLFDTVPSPRVQAVSSSLGSALHG